MAGFQPLRSRLRGPRVLLALAVIPCIFAALLGASLEIGARLLAGERASLARFQMQPYPDMSPFRPSVDLAYELVPRVKDWTNALGMRDRERDVRNRAGAFRVALISDSVGMYGRFPEALEALLNRDGGRPIEIWNWSIGGFGIKEYAQLLERRILRHRPDAVLLALELSDLTPSRVVFRDDTGQLRCYRDFMVEGPLRPLLYRHSAFYRLSMSYLERRTATDVEESERMMRHGRGPLSRIRALAEKRKIPVIALVLPRMKPLAEYTPQERTAWRAIRLLLEEQRVAAFDLADHIPARLRRASAAGPNDTVHLSPTGDRIVAAAIASEIRRLGWAR